MNALIVYDSLYGNTERIAQAIAGTLGGYGLVRPVHLGKAQPPELDGVDLLVVGSPTQRWRPTTAMQSYLDSLPRGSLQGIAAVAFDTRFRAPGLFTGSASRRMASQLQKAGARLLLHPESFYVAGTQGPLRDGEVEHAAAWAQRVYEAYSTQPRAR